MENVLTGNITVISIIFLFISFVALNGATYLGLLRFMKLQTNRVPDFNDKLCFGITSFLLSFSMGIFLASLLIHNKSLELTLNERLSEIESRPLIRRLVCESGDGPHFSPRNAGYIPWAMKPYGSIPREERYRNAGTNSVISPHSYRNSGEPGVSYPMSDFGPTKLDKVKGYFRKDC